MKTQRIPYKPYFEFILRKKAEIENYEPTDWDEMISSGWITADIYSHNAMALDRQLSMSKFNCYDNIHTIDIFLVDFSTNEKDKWNVIFISRCESSPKSLTHPENNKQFQESVIYRFVRHSDGKRPQWIWK